MSSSEEILWALLENETHIGVTLTKSPERIVRRLLLGGASPEDYEAERQEPAQPRIRLPPAEIEPPPPAIQTPSHAAQPSRRHAHFSAVPSPAYSLPAPPELPPRLNERENDR